MPTRGRPITGHNREELDHTRTVVPEEHRRRPPRPAAPVTVVHPDGTRETVSQEEFDLRRENARRNKKRLPRSARGSTRGSEEARSGATSDSTRNNLDHAVLPSVPMSTQEESTVTSTSVVLEDEHAQSAETAIQSRRYRTTEDYLYIDALKVDLSYHRAFDRAHAKKMLAEAGGEYVDEVGRYILASRRTDGDYIIVGLHRAQLAKLAGRELIPAVIVHGITLAQEAELARIESARRKESPLDQFRQEFIAGHDEAIAIVNVVERNRSRIYMGSSRKGSHTKAFDAVNTLRAIYRIDKGKTLDEALSILREAYGEVPTDAATLRGLSDFLSHKDHRKIGIDRKRLVESLARDGYKSHTVTARDLKPIDSPRRVGHLRAFVDSYNHGRRKARLPQPWKG